MTSAAEIATLLRSIMQVTKHELPPLVAQDYGRHRLELIEMVLARAHVDLEGNVAKDLIADLTTRLSQIHAEALPEPLQSVVRDIAASSARAEATVTLERLRAALAASEVTTAVGREALCAVLVAVAAADHAVRQGQENAIVALRERIAGQRSSVEELRISEPGLTAYLRRRFPLRPALRAANVVPVPGGRSKATVLFDLVDGDDVQPLVIRKEFTRDFMNCSLVDEYPVVRAAWEAGLPVPEPHWLEDDASVLDGRFIVFSRLPGKACGNMFENHASPAVVRQFAGVLARLHAIDIERIGIRDRLEFGRASFPVLAMIEASYAKHRRITPDNLLLESAHLWLMNHLGCVERAPRLIHGDAAFHNVLADNDTLTALLDWEMAHAGDPAEDLAGCKSLVETVIAWEEFVAAYRAAGGAPVSQERIHFFQIWKMLYYIMFAASARDFYLRGVDTDLRLGTIGYNTFNRLQCNLGRLLSGV